MTKRFISTCVLAAILILLFPVIAHADVIWTPPDDFYEKNYSKCDYLGRTFYANGASGYVSVKKEPGSSMEVGTITNGLMFYVSFTYDQQGDLWGVIMPDEWAQTPIGNATTGWVPMDQLILAYDYISFDEEHKDEFYNYTGDYSSLFEVDKLVFWAWPGSGKITMVHDSPTDRSMEPARNWLVASYAYTDSEGREWGFIPYFYASKNNWVCLSDPGNNDIPAFGIKPMPELYTAADPSDVQELYPAADPSEAGERAAAANVGESPSQGNGLSVQLIVIVIVAVLVIGTAVLIRVFWKPKKD